MGKRKKSQKGLEGELREVKNAGYTASKKVKRDKSVNRRAGLHDKLKNTEGETRVKRCKPLALKHVRRMRKVAAVFALGLVGAIAVFGVGFLAPRVDSQLDDVGNPTVCNEPPTDGSKPTAYTLVENVGFLNYVLQHQPYWSSTSTTDVDAAMGVKQQVKNYKKYYNDIMISADCSFSGLTESMQYGEQFCQVENAVLNRYSTSGKTEDLNKGMNAPWSAELDNALTVAAFRENRGLPPLDFSVYVLNEKTIENAYDTTVVDNGDGTYSMTLKLNVNTGNIETSADYYYRQQMWYNGKLNELPVISKTTLTYTYDSNWQVLSLVVEDAYRAKAMGINSNCTSRTVTNYCYDEESAYNTFWEDFFKEKYETVKDSLSDDAVINKEETPTAMSYLGTAFASVMTDGAVFKVDLSLDNFAIGGVVSVEMDEGGLSGLSAKLGDILVWLDGNTLYINDGNAKYKLNTGAISLDGDLAGGLDLATLMGQMTSGEFTFNEATGIATLKSKLSLFGLDILLNFEFQKDGSDVLLNGLNAEIAVGEKTVEASLCFGTESDKPVIPQNVSDYKDILNEGIAFDVSLKIDDFVLDGIVKIIMDKGAFNGVYADFGNIGVYYDCPHNMLYLNVGVMKYKLDIQALGTVETDASKILELFDIEELIGNLVTNGKSIGTSLNLQILEPAIKAFINVSLDGGLGVNAGVSLGGSCAVIDVKLCNGQVVLPDLKGYEDILNTEITLDVALTVYADVHFEGEPDKLNLNGRVTLSLKNGEICEVRADLGIIKIYYEIANGILYANIDGVKLKIDLSGYEENSFDFSSVGNLFDIDLPMLLKDLIHNITASATAISANANVSVFDCLIPVSAKLDLSDGITVEGGAVLCGINVSAAVSFSANAIGALSAEDKEEYIALSSDIMDTLLDKIGNRIAVEVSGEIYAYDGENEAYESSYNFYAALEFDGNEDFYVHLSLNLVAASSSGDSVYFDFLIKENSVYIYLSKYGTNADNPLRLYIPVEELANVVSMVSAMANINGMSFGNNEELAAAFNQIYGLLNSALNVEERLGDTAVKFASLGESLIPQIFSALISAESEKEQEESFKLDLSQNYVSSVGTKTYEDGRSALVLVLNSAILFGDGLDDLKVELFKDGNFLLSGAEISNVYFGSDNSSKLNLRFAVSPDFKEVETPDVSNYFNLTGIDELLKTFVNSATHVTTKEEYEAGATAEYFLNTQYYIDGQVNINFLGLSFAGVTIQVKNFFVTINEDNSVEFNISIYHDSFVGVISEKADVDLTIKDDMIYMRKSTDGGATYNYRIMTLDAFSADIMNQIQYVFGFSDYIMSKMSGGGSSNEVTFDDYGDYLSKLLSKYAFTENGSTAKWSFEINKDFINGIAGLSLLSENVSVNFNASLDESGTAYKFNSLSVSGAMFSLIKFSAELNYRNAQYVWDNGNDLTNNVVKLDSDAKYGLDGYSWTEVLGGTTLEEIQKTVDWNKLVYETSGSTWLEYNGSNIKAGVLGYEGEISSGIGYLYVTAAGSIYSEKDIQVNISYNSDLSFNNGLYSSNAAYVLGENGELLTASSSQATLLGWFMEVGGSYKFVTSYADISEIIISNNFTVTANYEINVTLWAVWYSEVTVSITSTSRSSFLGISTWAIGGNFTGGDYASDMSRTVAEAAGVTRTVQIRYELNSNENHCDGTEVSDKLNSGSWYTLSENTFSKSGMTCTNSASYGGARVKVTFTLNGTTLATPERSAYKSK